MYHCQKGGSMAYLYGASIQGIQGFIFESNELRNIIGASEIVKKFDDIDFRTKPFLLEKDPIVYLQAAGNIRLEIEDQSDIKKIAMHLPKYIMQMAYGITVSQAVVNKEKHQENAKELLETRLKIQRNRVSMPLDYSINMMKLDKKSARAETTVGSSMGTKLKLESFEFYKRERNFTEEYNISNLSNKKSKIAIIHADGNGLGDIVRHYTGNDMSSFSKSLNDATVKAFDEAKKVFDTKDRIYREVILGGDDLTLICHADYAIEFTKSFLANFQKQTKEKLEDYKKSIDIEGYTGELTACAGIAFCNEKYPFHMAVALAEDLCKYAKDKSDRKKSALMFHNIQGSYSKSFQDYLDSELVAKGKEVVYFNYGPYYLESDPSIEALQSLAEEFKRPNSPISSLRNWIEELHYNQEHAQTLLKRIEANIKTNGWESTFNKFIEKRGDTQITRIYDILQLFAVVDTIVYNKEVADEEV
jgi:hypothetical protein